uniref:Cytochrome b n=1 Tax=Amblyseiulella paraheveae TaxID=3049516 RepID=A0AAU6PBE3_9ACAR
MINKTMKMYYMPMPSNIYYWWNFGSLLGFCLLTQIISGLFLSMFYENNMINTFDSISHIDRNVSLGWLLRSIHANGASMFFIFIYLHIGRGLFFKSYYLWKVWLSGASLLLILFMTAFIGYVLPWGQMSFWGATVITNLLTSIPYMGKTLTLWLWGGFSISKSTLTRFFSLHFLLPFIMLLMMMLHIIYLHEQGSSNPLGVKSSIDKIPFQPFFIMKDLMGIMFILTIFLLISILNPSFFMDPDNFIPANPLVTPPHIQPEWYFLFAYAILRTIPNKLGGVIALFMSILIIFFLPLVKNYQHKHNLSNKILLKSIFFFWVMNFIYLSLMGAMPIETPYEELSTASSLLYFIYFLLLV